MTTVREATYELLRELGMTVIFGNPGSTELPFLRDMPSDFRYVLGLHERVAAGMALGYHLGSRKPVFVNLHSIAIFYYVFNKRNAFLIVQKIL